MKAVTLYQPWASLVIAGVKRFETRPMRTHYRGPLAIHAGKLTGRELVRAIGEDAYCELAGIVAECDLPSTRIPDLPRGVILGTVEVVDCLEMVVGWPDGDLYLHSEHVTARSPDLLPIDPLEWSLGEYDLGRYAWQLINPVAFPEPIPARGQQGLWTWDELACTFDRRAFDCDVCPTFATSERRT